MRPDTQFPLVCSFIPDSAELQFTLWSGHCYTSQLKWCYMGNQLCLISALLPTVLWIIAEDFHFHFHQSSGFSSLCCQSVFEVPFCKFYVPFSGVISFWPHSAVKPGFVKRCPDCCPSRKISQTMSSLEPFNKVLLLYWFARIRVSTTSLFDFILLITPLTCCLPTCVSSHL